MAGIGTIAYNSIFKRTSTFLAAAVFASFFFERGTEVITATIWDNANKGKQWKDIKHQFEK